MGPDLFETWPSAAKRARDLFPGQGRELLRVTAEIMAGSCRRAIDYIEQAPVCVLLEGANFGVSPRNALPWVSDWVKLPHMRMRLAASFAARVARGPRLRAMLRDIWENPPLGACRPVMGPAPAGLYQLRALRGGAIRQSRFGLVSVLALIAPSVLAQVIPATRTRQGKWLSAMSGWLDLMERRSGRLQVDVRALTLAARVAALRSFNVGQGSHMGDFMVARPESTVLSPAQFMNELDAWDALRGEATRIMGIDFELGPVDYSPNQFMNMLDAWDAGEATRIMGIDFELGPVDYAPLPNDETTVAHIRFVPLRSYHDLIIEGQAMRNCVASYWSSVVAGAARVFSVRMSGGNRAATLEVGRRGGMWEVMQVKGLANTRVPALVADAARVFVDVQNFARIPSVDEEVA